MVDFHAPNMVELHPPLRFFSSLSRFLLPVFTHSNWLPLPCCVRVRSCIFQVSALIHTANRDYKALIEDLVSLEVLPADTDRGQVRCQMMKPSVNWFCFSAQAKTRKVTFDRSRAALASLGTSYDLLFQ